MLSGLAGGVPHQALRLMGRNGCRLCQAGRLRTERRTKHRVTYPAGHLAGHLAAHRSNRYLRQSHEHWTTLRGRAEGRQGPPNLVP